MAASDASRVNDLVKQGRAALKGGDPDQAAEAFAAALRLAPLRRDIRDLLAVALEHQSSEGSADASGSLIREAPEDEAPMDFDEDGDIGGVAPSATPQLRKKKKHKDPTRTSALTVGPLIFAFAALILISFGFFFFFSSSIQSFIQNLGKSKQEVRITPEDSESAELFRQAQSFQDQRRYTEAIPLIEKAMTLSPTNQKQYEDKLAELYFQKAEALYKKDDYTKAIEAYKKAVELSPDSAEYLKGLGWANYIQGRKNQNRRQRAAPFLEEARSAFQKAIQKDPDNIRLLNDLARVYIAQNSPSKAADLYRQIIQKAPDTRDAEQARRSLQSMGFRP